MKIDRSKFRFQYLPDYSDFLLNNKLDEFVTVGIRFCLELNLPMMRPLAKVPEKELVALSLESNRETLTALSQNDIVPQIEKNLRKFTENRITDTKGIKILDNTEVVAEDIILAFHIRRKLFKGTPAA